MRKDNKLLSEINYFINKIKLWAKYRSLRDKVLRQRRLLEKVLSHPKLSNKIEYHGFEIVRFSW
jgi:hypothetical protein